MQQQTATADVHQVISRLDIDLRSASARCGIAARLCEADSAEIHRQRVRSWPYIASYGLSREYDKYMRRASLQPGSRKGVLEANARSNGKAVPRSPTVVAD